MRSKQVSLDWPNISPQRIGDFPERAYRLRSRQALDNSTRENKEWLRISMRPTWILRSPFREKNRNPHLIRHSFFPGSREERRRALWNAIKLAREIRAWLQQRGEERLVFLRSEVLFTLTGRNGCLFVSRWNIRCLSEGVGCWWNVISTILQKHSIKLI